MKLIILIVPGLVLVGMMMYFQSNGGKELDSYMKKIWTTIAGCATVFTLLMVFIIIKSMFFEDEGKIYDKYSYNHIRLHKEQDRQMEKVIELLDDIKTNTDYIGRDSRK